jgi:hypothetical protein
VERQRLHCTVVPYPAVAASDCPQFATPRRLLPPPGHSAAATTASPVRDGPGRVRPCPRRSKPAARRTAILRCVQHEGAPSAVVTGCLTSHRRSSSSRFADRARLRPTRQILQRRQTTPSGCSGGQSPRRSPPRLHQSDTSSPSGRRASRAAWTCDPATPRPRSPAFESGPHCLARPSYSSFVPRSAARSPSPESERAPADLAVAVEADEHLPRRTRRPLRARPPGSWSVRPELTGVDTASRGQRLEYLLTTHAEPHRDR